jgi:hypothetical protein
LAVSVALLAIAWGATARAASARSFALEYPALEGCPARAAVVASILERAPEAQEVTTDAELRFQVDLEQHEGLTRGLLRVRFRGGESYEREVPPSSCPEVLTAMEIMAGLLLSGALLPEPAPPATPGSTALERLGQDAPSLRDQAPPPAAAPSPAGDVVVGVRIVPERDPAFVSPPSAPVRRSPWGRLRAGAAAYGDVASGALSSLALGGGVGLEVALDRASAFAPSVRAGVEYQTARKDHAPEGGARFRLWALFVRVCPLRFELSPALAAGTCALVEVGSLSAGGRSTSLPVERRMPWVALGSALRLSVRLSSSLSLEGEGRAFELLRHDRFVLQPGSIEVIDIPAFSGAISVGVLAQVP